MEWLSDRGQGLEIVHQSLSNFRNQIKSLHLLAIDPPEQRKIIGIRNRIVNQPDNEDISMDQQFRREFMIVVAEEFKGIHSRLKLFPDLTPDTLLGSLLRFDLTADRLPHARQHGLRLASSPDQDAPVTPQDKR